jgi:hypothetical protein
MLIIEDVIVSKLAKTKFLELTVSFKIKPDDYSLDDQIELEQYWVGGDLLTLKIEKYQEPQQDNIMPPQ